MPANLIETRLADFSAQSPVDKWTTRASRYGALDLFKQQSDDPMGIISDELKEKAIAAAGSNLKVPVLNYDGSVQVTAETIPVTLTDQPNTSANLAVTFVNYFWSFFTYPAAHFNNEISLERDFNRKLQKCIFEFLNQLDTSAVAALELAKTQVLNDDLGGRYALTGNTIVAPLIEEGAIIGDINPLMGGNDYYGPFSIVGNPSFESHVRNKLLEKGEFNTDDKTYQWIDKTFHFTNNVANAAGQKATAFAVQQGSLGMLQQFQPDCVMGNTTHKHEWGISILPIANMPIGTYYYNDAVDASAFGAHAQHLTATKVEAYGFHTAIAFVTPYLADPATEASPVAKIAIANA